MPNIHFILVEPAVPENIGAAARAIKTMGFTSLKLVNPCHHLSDQARWLAHGANDILENAMIFNNFDEIIKNHDLVIGTSAKKRKVKHEYYPLDILPHFISEKENTAKNIAIAFGREEHGLHNQELHKCDIISYVPMKTTYPSLNLAQAVMIFAYRLSAISLPKKESNTSKNNILRFRAFQEDIQYVLKKIGMDNSPVIHNRILEKANSLSAKDMNLIQSVCNKLKTLVNNKTDNK